MDCKEFMRLAEEWKKDVCIFGAGDFGANDGFHILKEAGFHIEFYCDNNQHGKCCNGLKVFSIERLEAVKNDILCMVAVYGKAGDEIVLQLNDMGVKHIFRLADDYIQWDLAQYLDELGDKDVASRFPYIMDDIVYLKRRFKQRVNGELNLKNPKTFNEKIQWLKIYDRQPIYTTLADKYAVKQYVSEKIGSQYVVPLLGVWNSFDDIDFDSLPQQFVIKCTHDCGSVVICKDKNQLNYVGVREKIETALRRNYYWPDREWSYYGIQPRIIAETMLTDNNDEIMDYKLMCFNGKVRCVFVCTERFSEDGLKVTFFDREWNRMPFERHYPSSKKEIKKPYSWKVMLDLAETLSENIPFVRIDFYEINNCPYFGEFTFYPGSGCEKFIPEEWDTILGEWMILPSEE